MIRPIRRIRPIWALFALAAMASAAEPPRAPRLREVIVVFKTHFDIGYTDLARNVVAHYRTGMIDRALAVCDQTRTLPPEQRFVWTLPGWPMTQLLGPQQTQERRQRILDAVRDGRFVWHAFPFTVHTESLDLEDLVRGMRFSSELSRSLGRPLPRAAKMTDITCHTWLLPTLLRHAGVEFLHLGCNAACPMPDVPTLFWWEGPDGSRLLTMYAGDYGTGLTPPRDWPHATWLALIHTGDNQGPPSTADVQALVARAARDLPGIRVRMGELSDFADAIRRENPDLPVIRADMPDTWIQGILSMPQETGIARNTRPAIGALESLNTLLRIWGVSVPSAAATVAAAYEQSLLYGEHTWGIDFKRFGRRLYGAAWEAARARGAYALAEESWAEHGSYARRAESLTTPALAANLDALARAVNVAGPRIVVFNPLPWERSGIAEVAVPAGVPAGLADAETRKAVPAERLGDRIRFLASAVPPMGFRTYVPSNGEPETRTLRVDRASATLTNGQLRLRLDPARGTIAELHGVNGGDLADNSSPYGLGQYLYERFDADQIKSYLDAYLRQKVDWAKADLGRTDFPTAKEKPYAAASPKNFALEFREGPVSITATMRAPASEAVPHAVAIAVTLYRQRPYVDIEWTITGKRPDPWPEAGWLCFPFAIDRPRVELGRVGSLVNPAVDFRKATNRDILCLNTGLRITGQDSKGVGLCPLDSPLVSLERPGLWRFTRDFVPTKPAVFVNLFNNAIATNFQQWASGTWTSRVRLWAFAGGGQTESLVTPSWEARSPLRAAYFDGPAGPLPPRRAGIELSRKGVLVTAFGPNPDGEGTLLRLWEQGGSDEPCRVHLPDGLRARQAQPVDLRGRPAGEPIPIRDGDFTVPMPRFAPVSIVLTGE